MISYNLYKLLFLLEQHTCQEYALFPEGPGPWLGAWKKHPARCNVPQGIQVLLLKTREIQIITINCIPETAAHPLHMGVSYIGPSLFWVMLDLYCCRKKYCFSWPIYLLKVRCLLMCWPLLHTQQTTLLISYKFIFMHFDMP